MIQRKLISFGDMSCDYRVGSGALEHVSSYASSVVGLARRVVLVREEEASASALQEVSRGLIDAGFQIHEFVVPASAHRVDLSLTCRLFDACEQASLTSDDLMVGFGSADLCGMVSFVAQSWVGGIASLMVPTTLDAMVVVATHMDGISLGSFPHMISVPARPAMVVADIDLLKGTDIEKRHLGHLLLIASALMDSRRSWTRIAELIPDLLQLDEAALSELLTMAQASRLAAERSQSPAVRKGTEFGYVTARALEACLDPVPKAYHALAEGMRFEARLGTEAGRFEIDDAFALDDMFETLGIFELPFVLDENTFIEALYQERYRRSGRMLLALPQMVGSIRLSVADEDLLRRHARAYVASRAALADSDASHELCIKSEYDG
ncbi:hypothetical protein K6V98_07010 [Collinsella sp. AGMB00827]|uniref:3-dehydroquinate synthase N-terminal domain-containing protein n=1 Tax=Collinsella ureilytica TaxID=2869515 RepID=A0ABS7MLC0_9ACTN|nr:hypothetical protein [Collinsella urealyticum]MBY4798092.1 hypothetical protein [Collinsella urealyticum]